MKLAILADIHANFPALQAVADHIEAWGPDNVIVAGDILNRGPKPQECLRFIQEKNHANDWRLLIGNHEEYVIKVAKPVLPPFGPEFEFVRNAYWTYQQLGCDVSALEALPFLQTLYAPDGSQALVTHASMRGTRDGIFPETGDDTLRKQIGGRPQLLAVGHTHRPLIRHIDNTLVVNVGAVGMPFDGDPRACYAQLTWHSRGWQAELIRLVYDQDQALRDFHESGFLEEGGALTQIMLFEFHTARSHTYRWTRQYYARVMAQELSFEAAVQAYIDIHSGSARSF